MMIEMASVSRTSRIELRSIFVKSIPKKVFSTVSASMAVAPRTGEHITIESEDCDV